MPTMTSFARCRALSSLIARSSASKRRHWYACSGLTCSSTTASTSSHIVCSPTWMRLPSANARLVRFRWRNVERSPRKRRSRLMRSSAGGADAEREPGPGVQCRGTSLPAASKSK